MRSIDLKALRQRLGLDRLQFARLIGYTGADENDKNRVRKYENQVQPPLYIARLAWLIEQYRLSTGRWPDFPKWQGYDFGDDDGR